MKKTEALATVDPSILEKPPSQWRRLLGFQNISAIYIFIVIFIIFSIWTPQTFLKPQTWANLLDTNSLLVMAALAVLVPLVTGVFNLAVGAEIQWAMALCIVLQLKPEDFPDLALALNTPWPLAVLITIVVGGLIGMVSGLVITKLRIDSFIATLGMSSILVALTYLISANRPLKDVQPGFHEMYGWHIPLGDFRLTFPVIVLIVIAFVVWYLLERTPVGRRMYAAGFNPDGARLSGVNVGRLQLGATIAGGLIAGVIGVLASSKVYLAGGFGAGMLIPALSAVFLGSTQFKGGRFNVWGTVLALYVLAVGVLGLTLVKVPDLFTDFFYGVALIGAVAMSRWERTSKRTRAIRRATTLGAEAKAKLAAEDEAQLPPQLTPTQTALKQDGIEDQGDKP